MEHKKLSPRVVEALLQITLFESANRDMLHEKLKQKLDVDISPEELKKTRTFYDLFNKIQENTK